MKSSKKLPITTYLRYFAKFKEGNERGLEFFYKLLYPRVYYYGVRYIKDDVKASSIVNEAFLKLWLSRKIITGPEHIDMFVKKLTSDGCRAYYKTSTNRFNRNMLRLDDIENYQEFIGGYDVAWEDDPEILYSQEYTHEEKTKWERVEAVIPNLSQDQQLFIKLCIKYSFDYGKMAWHIGGISDYQVARKVEKTLECLKAVISDTEKLSKIQKNSRFSFEGDVNEEQSMILKMRYELQYSFSEIAEALSLDQGYIQKAFAAASLKIRKVKIR
ncbi:RNA polymerase sigma factor [Pedobacter rhizosphaerae]|uniref:DNA-directed RNA polymerase specialized sigma subunit, sigma24 family n=1 Tax=Pedobacter rhizosphaerae TaxID=390241 RepID=A0A1H9VWC2_9SPHI|nr:sigma-70 family RNA polymerase sigma factor [Pedobacter rhizosphaerae]SES26100.1 DNA-directed RNA polymerase specialized sigma subunit, sigma24 family [Pedobacter rhizosphaerae]